MNKAKNFAERVEFELLSALLKYIVPVLGKKINPAKKKDKEESKLEAILNEKPKISFGDVKELENMLLNNLQNNVKSRKNIGINSNNLFYSLNLRRQKNKEEKTSGYSISIKYEENSGEEKLKVEIKKEGKELYSSEIINKKETKDKVAPYGLAINYEDSYAEEMLTISYRKQLRNYLQKHIEDKEDMTNRVPLKWLNVLPESVMGGILGFTYLGENFMGRRADLTGWTAKMVDIHESIHTPDEYETRVLTSWIMENARENYIKTKSL